MCQDETDEPHFQIKSHGQLGVRVGNDDLEYKDLEEGKKGYISVAKEADIISIEKIIEHPNFVFAKIEISPKIHPILVGNDIALIKLSEKKDKISIVKLPSKPRSEKSSCKTSGKTLLIYVDF